MVFHCSARMESSGALVVRRKREVISKEHCRIVMQTFAAQSVVAIENARLFTEIEEKSRQLAVAVSTSRNFSPT